MPFTEFTCRSGGSNLNAGSLDGSAEAATAPLVTYTNGAWVSGTGVFTPASGNPVSDGVAVGQWVSIYTDGASAPTGFVARVTARDTLTITVSLTAKSGTIPTTGVSGITLVVGGAWQGPNGTSGFPFGFVQNTLTNAAGDTPRINFKNAATYSVTAAVSHSLDGPTVFQGYATAFGDYGRAVLDGGTGGSGYDLLALNNTSLDIVDFELANNGGTGNTALLLNMPGAHAQALRLVIHHSRGSGLSFSGGGYVYECEGYACNLGGSGGSVAVFLANHYSRFVRCIAHDTSCPGYSTGGFGVDYDECVADTCSIGFDFLSGGITSGRLRRCDAYNNTSHGVSVNGAAGSIVYLENCNLVDNGGYGVTVSTNVRRVRLFNCGFGAGTRANTSGQTNGASGLEVIGSVTYATDVTPWVDPANGDFRINLDASKGTGRGNFMQTASGYAGTIAYPDIGAAQHQEISSGSGSKLPQVITAPSWAYLEG